MSTAIDSNTLPSIRGYSKKKNQTNNISDSNLWMIIKLN